jgi:hypothetical protein
LEEERRKEKVSSRTATKSLEPVEMETSHTSIPNKAASLIRITNGRLRRGMIQL